MNAKKKPRPITFRELDPPELLEVVSPNNDELAGCGDPPPASEMSPMKRKRKRTMLATMAPRSQSNRSAGQLTRSSSAVSTGRNLRFFIR